MFSTLDNDIYTQCVFKDSFFFFEIPNFVLQPAVNWVVPVSEKVRYDEIFLKTDTDMDGFVSGQEVKDIFMHSGLSQNLLAHIW